MDIELNIGVLSLKLVGGTTDGSRRITTGLAIASIMYMPADMRVDI